MTKRIIDDSSGEIRVAPDRIDDCNRCARTDCSGDMRSFGRSVIYKDCKGHIPPYRHWTFELKPTTV